MTHICVSDWTRPSLVQVVHCSLFTSTNADMLPMGFTGTNFSEIWIDSDSDSDIRLRLRYQAQTQAQTQTQISGSDSDIRLRLRLRYQAQTQISGSDSDIRLRLRYLAQTQTQISGSDSDSDKVYSTKIDTISGLHKFHEYISDHISLIYNEL